METTKIVLFKGRRIRKALNKNEWWFVVNDVVKVLTDTPNVKDYVKKMRSRDSELSKGWGQIVTPLSIDTKGGAQKLNCANTEGIFRIIQSILDSNLVLVEMDLSVLFPIMMKCSRM